MALRDEALELGPKMPGIGCACAFARDAERLARTTSRPNGPVVGTSCKPECNRPSSNSGEEVTLNISGKVAGLHVRD
jgi:hypothetical protein